MKNKVKLKKLLIIILLISLIAAFVFSFLNIYEYKKYTQNFNQKISEITLQLQKEYPNVTEENIMKILNNKSASSNLFAKYNINLDTDSLVLKNADLHHHFLIINIGFIILIMAILVLIFLNYNKNKDKDIKEITNYIKQINQKNYSLDISRLSEDELSILKQEIYKTTILLKESAENSLRDKQNIKKYIEDISHQLKTPLTSILIILDNLIEKENMDLPTYQEFIKDIKREITNINSLVENLLTLSSFEVNAIDLIRKEIFLKDLITSSVQVVGALCDLKNIKIKINGDNKIKLKCDMFWQKQAISNILKNAIEHSKSNSIVNINYKENNIYVKISTENRGQIISSKDLQHIFKRFYKGENAKANSIGIGLSLAKTIINNDNGAIDVKSDKDKTTFIIKYYKI